MNVKMKKAQLTIFIIIGVILVGAVLLFFLFREGVIRDVFKGREIEPKSFIESCIEDKLREGVELISMQGGNVNPKLYKNFRFDNEKIFRNISYLCYTQNYYTPCVNQEPILINHLKDELKSYIKDDIETCFWDLKSSLEKQNYAVNAEYTGFDIGLMPKKIVIKIDWKISLIKSGESSIYEGFEIIFPTKFYDLAIVAQEIVNQEARFCNFEHLGFMLIYPEINIDKFMTGDSTKIYTVQYRDNEEKFRFAVRSCATKEGI